MWVVLLILFVSVAICAWVGRWWIILLPAAFWAALATGTSLRWWGNGWGEGGKQLTAMWAAVDVGLCVAAVWRRQERAA
jgi:hypothetical protein